MKILAVTTMYPNRIQPVHAVFIKQRLMHIKRYCDLTIICPIPYFPYCWKLERYRHRRSIPLYENHEGINVYYPRYFSIPKYLKPMEAFFITLKLLAFIKKKKIEFDIIEAHLPFPEGIASVLIGKIFKKPVSITLRGHDINLLPMFPVRKRMIQYTLNNCSAIFSVADALKKGAEKIGINGDRIEVLGNGVDPDRFFLLDKKESRKRLDLPQDKKIILCVGHLVERKGFHLVVDAVAGLIKEHGLKVLLVIIGEAGEEGDFSSQIKNRIKINKIESAVLLPGAIKNENLVFWYNAADLFCLASSKEGWANVLLESLACGTPVVATDVWGTPEVINNLEVGILVKRDCAEIAAAIHRAINQNWDRVYLNKYANNFTWENISKKIYREYQSLLATS